MATAHKFAYVNLVTPTISAAQMLMIVILILVKMVALVLINPTPLYAHVLLVIMVINVHMELVQQLMVTEYSLMNLICFSQD